MGAPVANSHFAKELEDDGLLLPDDLLGLYAACDGFDLSCVAATHQLPVFSMLPSESIDVSEEEDGYPRRPVLFQGGDEIQFSVFRDRKKQWWIVYEHEYQPIAKKLLHLRELLRLGMARMNANDLSELDGQGALSWERYFAMEG
jgi:hypothetical protein